MVNYASDLQAAREVVDEIKKGGSNALAIRADVSREDQVRDMFREMLGAWDAAPRSHPNDGLLDTFVAALPLGERLKVRSRLPLGTHVPHPGIIEARVAAVQWDVEGVDVWLDGERLGPAHSLSIRIEPDAITCVV